MKRYHPLDRRRRARGAMAGIIVLLGGLVAVFFRVQVIRSSTWRLRSENNRLRPLPIPAPRGTIYDREGRVLADNVPAYSISVLPAPADSMRSTLEKLRPHLQLTEEDVDRLLKKAKEDPTRPVTVTSDASFDQVSAVEERSFEIPGLLIETRPKRRYLGGAATAHVLGYVGEVTRAELKTPRFKGYEPGTVVGKEGIEREYEHVLQGTRGVRYVEVDALGRIVGSFRGVSRTPARKGHDLHLNIDLDLQRWIRHIFPDTMRGAVVALDAKDGSVLALYSSPSYDPNEFVGGIDEKDWKKLNDDPARPLYDRAVLGLYPPASTWKVATAAIGLELGLVEPDSKMPQPCTGGIQFGNRYFHDWKPSGHGDLDLIGALANSCDVYFYQLGDRIGLDRLLKEGTRFGFSRPTGVDLPHESSGIFPSSESFWQKRFGYKPTEAEALNLAIGQGPNSQTPIKMAQFYVAVAGDGTAPAPKIAERAAPKKAWKLNLSRSSLAALREGLREVVDPGGTAYLSSLQYWDLMGKTGTGQNAQDPTRDHAWFAGMAGPPGKDPEIVVVALVEFGQHGSSVAAPIVAKTADYYLRRKYGMPIDTIQTLGEHWKAGVPAPWYKRGGGKPRWQPGDSVGASEAPGREAQGVQKAGAAHGTQAGRGT